MAHRSLTTPTDTAVGVATNSLWERGSTTAALIESSFHSVPFQVKKAGSVNGRQEYIVFMYLRAERSFLSLITDF